MSRKRGKLSTEEENFIISNVHDMTEEEIAKVLNRTVDPIIKYIENNRLKHRPDKEEVEQHKRLLGMLRNRAYYNDVVEQLNKSEMKYFEDTWVAMVMQFREDVLYTEELQIKQLIILDILMGRSMKERKRCIEEADNLRRQLDIEYKQVPRDEAMIRNLEAQISYIRSAITSYSTEHKNLLGESKFITKSLKANRDERIQRVEDAKASWVGHLRILEDEKEREALGRHLELMKMATDKAKQRLAQDYQFPDDKFDKPILSLETLEDDEDAGE